MNILLANDDGYDAAGIHALAKEMVRGGHRVILCAPRFQQSGMAHAMSVKKAFEVSEVPELKKELGVQEAYQVDGTPTDSVKLYLEALKPANFSIDLVLSGINDGANLATDVLYSGTVGAALEGYLHDIPSIAVSLDYEAGYSFEQAAQLVRPFIEERMESQKEKVHSPFFLNINFPASLAKDAVFVMSRLGKRDYENAYKKTIDADGRITYWASGEIVDSDNGAHTDLLATSQGHISVTPLATDLTDFSALEDTY